MCICLLSGCGYAAEDESIQGKTEENGSFTTLGLTPEFDYEVPESLPGILVDQAGYASKSKKVAIFRGDRMPERFDVVQEETGRIVYTGEIEDRGYNSVIGENNSYGVFDDLTEEGSYYIQASFLGRSYSFAIEDDIYNNIFEAACRQYYLNRCGMTLVQELAGDAAHTACHMKLAFLSEDTSVQLDVSGGWHMDERYSKNVGKGSCVLANLLLAYELYPEAFSDSAGIPESGNGIPDILDEMKYETDWMMRMQDGHTGGVYSEAAVKGEDAAAWYSGKDYFVEPVTLQATAAFAAVMAKFSYVYQTFDKTYATECLRAADRAWKFLEKSRGGEEVEQRFFAAAELYRATGYASYREAAEQYLNDGVYEKMEDDGILWGCVTYLSTKQSVDVELCEKAMKRLMEEAEEISAGAKKSQYLTAGNRAQDNNDKLLHQMMRLTVADHIIANHEYETVIENHLHYLMGRNPKAISYLDGVGEKNYADIDIRLGIMNRFDLNAELVFMMSEVMSWHRNYE